MAKITLGGNPCNTIGELPGIGTKAPSFSLTTLQLEEKSLDEFQGSRLILNIFPSVETGVCASSIRKFNELGAGLSNTKVLCISMDLPFAQSRFCGAEGIENVEMLSNFRDSGSFGKDYGVSLLDGGFKGLDARSVVVIDENGTVIYTELVPETGDEPNYDEALNALN